MFDKSLMSRRPASVPALYCSENPPPSVRVFVSFDLLSFVIDEFVYLQTQGLYPKAHIDVEVSSDEDIVFRLKPNVSADQNRASASDDAR
jgi:hypothetical protein